MNLILIPIWLLSGAFFPAEGAPLWLRWTMKLNPLTYGMTALRRGLYLADPGAFCSYTHFKPSAAVALAFALGAFLLASRVARRASV